MLQSIPSKKLFRIAGVDVELDFTFMILAGILVISALVSRDFSQVGLYAMVFGIVICHEFGHIIAARRCGYACEKVLLTPLGGIAFIQGDLRKPMHQLIVASCGPLVNVAFALLGLLVILIMGYKAFPHDTILGNWTIVNLGMLIFNLIPAYPMDGGQITKGILGICGVKRRKRNRITWSLSRIIACVGIAIAIFTQNYRLIFLFGSILLFVHFDQKNTELSDRVSDAIRRYNRPLFRRRPHPYC